MTLSGAARVICLLCCGLLLAQPANAYPNGPPLSSCLDNQPYHRVNGGSVYHPPKDGTGAYQIDVSAPNWSAGGSLNVVITTRSDAKFEGFVLTAKRATGGYTDMSVGPLLGSFKCNNSHNTNVRYYSVYSPTNASNCVTQLTKANYKNLTCVWNAPTTNEGPVKFVATLVREFDSYEHIESKQVPNVAGNPANVSEVGNLSAMPSSSGCGETKICALYPSLCDQRGDCSHAVMMTRLSDSSLRVEMFGTSVEWIGLGLADNVKMRETELYTCAYNPKTGRAELQLAYSPQRSVVPVFRPEVTQVRTLWRPNAANGMTLPAQPNVIACEFTRPRVSNFTYYKFTKSSYANELVRVANDLDDGQYVTLAQGPPIGAVTPNSAKHIHKPLRSPQMFKSNSIVKMYFTGVSQKIQIHATMMTIMWLLLAGTSVILARHSRPVLTQKPFMNMALWYVGHVVCVIAGTLLSVAGVIYIIIAEGGWKSGSQTHGIFGLIGLGLGIVNIVAGFLRPDPNTRQRVFFNRLHRWNGLLAMLFAAISMWLGVTFEKLRPEFRLFTAIVLGVWTGLQVLFMLGFEIARRAKVHKVHAEQSREQSLGMKSAEKKLRGGEKDGQEEEEAAAAAAEEPPKPVKGKWIVHVNGLWLLLYCGVFVALLTAFLVGLWLY